MSIANDSILAGRIGARIKDRREELGLSLRKLAERMDRSIAGIHQLERGQSEPGASTIVRLCRVLGVSADWILGIGEGEKP